MTEGRLEFYYEFASPYSYLSAMRIEEMAARKKVIIEWKPFMLGPIIRERGFDTSPFNIEPDKGRYMWRDMRRLADLYDLPLVQLDPFPQNGLLASRLALVGLEEGWTPQFTRAIYFAEFGSGRDISNPDIVRDALETIGVDADRALTEAQSTEIKQRLIGNGADAKRHNIFGAPNFVTADYEMFWGNDRLEIALDWAAGGNDL